MKEIDITSKISFETCAAALKKIGEMIMAAYDRRDEEIDRLSVAGDFVGMHEVADRINAEIGRMESDQSIINRVFETDPPAIYNLYAILSEEVVLEHTITEAELDRVCDLVKQYA